MIVNIYWEREREREIKRQTDRQTDRLRKGSLKNVFTLQEKKNLCKCFSTTQVKYLFYANFWGGLSLSHSLTLPPSLPLSLSLSLSLSLYIYIYIDIAFCQCLISGLSHTVPFFSTSISFSLSLSHGFSQHYSGNFSLSLSLSLSLSPTIFFFFNRLLSTLYIYIYI